MLSNPPPPISFNTQPPEGGCSGDITKVRIQRVSTHSHPKVAAQAMLMTIAHWYVSTHSHPKVAAFVVVNKGVIFIVSTHSHPKVAAGGVLLFLFFT